MMSVIISDTEWFNLTAKNSCDVTTRKICGKLIFTKCMIK